MQAVHDGADLPTVDDIERGAAIQRRLDQLGISDREFHEHTGIDRKTLRRAVTGAENVRTSTYTAIEAALSKLEDRVRPAGVAGSDEAGLVTFKLSGNFGVDVVVQGPVSDMAELEAAVERLVRSMKDKDRDPDR